MIEGIWPWLSGPNGNTMLGLWGAFTGAQSMVSGIKSSKDMEAVIAQMQALNVKIERLSAHFVVAPDGIVVRATSQTASHLQQPRAEPKIVPPGKIAKEAEQRGASLHGQILSSAVVWTPEKFEHTFRQRPGDVLMNIQPAAIQLKIPFDTSMVPVLFADPTGEWVGWQKRIVLEQLFDIKIDELQWMLARGAKTPAAAPPPEKPRPSSPRASQLATRCPACATVFRIVVAQLKVSEGWVRCGQCDEVFHGVEALFDLDPDPKIARRAKS